MKKGSVSKKASVSKKGSVSKKDRVSNRASTQPEKRKKPAKICKGGSEKRVDRFAIFYARACPSKYALYADQDKD